MNTFEQNNLQPSEQDNTDKAGQTAINTKYEQNKLSDYTKEDNTGILPTTNNDLRSDSNNAEQADTTRTTERKAYGDTELNKGLEAQAKDEEL